MFRASGFETTGDGSNLWVVKGETQQLSIYHCASDNKRQTLQKILRLHGRLATNGISSDRDRLWLVYENLSVQSIRLQRAETVEYERRTEASLGQGMKLLSLASDRTGAWALVQGGTAQAMLDADAAPAGEVLEPGHGYDVSEPPSVLPTVEQPPQEDEMPGAQSLAGAQTLQHHLLRFESRGWAKMDLPTDWPHLPNSYAVVRRDTDSRPVLIAARATEAGWQVHYYRPEEAGWVRYDHATVDRAGPIQCAAIGHNIILAQQVNDEGALTVRVLLLRSEELNELGTVRFDGAVGQKWSLVQVAGQHGAAIITEDESGQFHIRQMDLQGQTHPASSEPPAQLQQRPSPPWIKSLDRLVLVVVLSAATLIMLVFWRRDTSWNQLNLPPQFVIADLYRRGLAGLIDMAPSVLVIFLFYGITPPQLYRHWPGQSAAVDEMIPGIVAIMLFIAISIVAELVVGRTLGKAVLGLRVVSLDGKRPGFWQIVVREGMKIFELIAWFLLILPAIAPHRKRLGDVVARTVVVMEAPDSSQE